MTKKIILIEDDENLRRGISFYLEQEGYEVIVINRVQGSIEKIRKNSPDLIILDVTLPDGNGFELCQEIRKFSAVPIFFLTALLETLWDDQGKFVDENALSVNIRRIRVKLEEDPKKPKYIETVRGVGYLWKRRE